MEQGLWGVEVKSLETGRVLYALNARKLMMPASNMKIVTLAAAAEALGLGLPLQDDARDDRADRERRPERRPHRPRQPAIRRSTAAATAPQRCSTNGRPRSRRPASAASTATSSATPSAFDRRRLGTGLVVGLPRRMATPRRSGALEFNEDIATLSIRPGAKAGDDAELGTDARHRTGADSPRGDRRGRVRHDASPSNGGPTATWLDVIGSIAVGRDARVARRGGRRPDALLRARAACSRMIQRGIPVRGLPVVLPRAAEHPGADPAAP